MIGSLHQSANGLTHRAILHLYRSDQNLAIAAISRLKLLDRIFPVLTEFESAYASLWVMIYFPPHNTFIHKQIIRV